MARGADWPLWQYPRSSGQLVYTYQQSDAVTPLSIHQQRVGSYIEPTLTSKLRCRNPILRRFRRSDSRLEGALKGKERSNMHRLVRIIAALTFVAATLVAASLRAAPVQAGTAQTYLVLYKGNSVATNAITAAGGTLVYAYNQIGVAVA